MTTVVLATLAFFSMGFAGCPADPVTGIATTAFAGMTVNQAIDRLTDRANLLVARAGNEGELAAARAGQQGLLMTRNLDLMLTEQRTQTFRSLDVQRQNAFLDIERFLEQAESNVNALVTTADLLTLSVEDWIGRALPWAGRTRFYISRVQGSTFLQEQGPHEMTISGLGIGFPIAGARQRTELTLSFDGHELPSGAIFRAHDRQIVVTIPQDLVSAVVSDDQVQRATLRMAAHVHEDPDWFLAFPFDHDYAIDIDVLVLPRRAGTIALTERIRPWTTRTITDAATLSQNVPASQTQRPFDFTQTYQAPENARIVGVRYECSGAGCGFCYPVSRDRVPSGYGPDYVISDEGRHVTVYRHCDGPFATVVHRIDTEVRERGAAQALATREIPVAFRQQVRIDLHPDNIDGDYELSATFVTGHRVSFDRVAPRGDGLLYQAGINQIGGRWQLALRTATP